MTDQEKFEQWATGYYGELSFVINSANHFTNPSEYRMPNYQASFEGWQAAKQDSAAEIAELKETMGHLDLYCGRRDTEIAQLQADNLKLREALAAILQDKYLDLRES